MPRSTHRGVGVGLALLGVYELALAAYMTLAPRSFFDTIGPFGAVNVHYIRDTATFNAALGVIALVAVRRAGWRVPVLFLAVVQFALHSVNHLVDIGAARTERIGVFDFVSLTVATVALGAGLWLARERVA